MKEDRTAALAQILIEERKCSMAQALDIVYNSATFRHLQNTATGYYYRSIGYLYDDLRQELTTRNAIICTYRGKAVPLQAEVEQRLRDGFAAPSARGSNK